MTALSTCPHGYSLDGPCPHCLGINENPEQKENATSRNIEIEEKKEESKEPYLIERLVKPHSKNSRLITEDDVNRVVEESKVLWQLCFEPSGLYLGAFAMAHPQIDDQDPLQLFVLVNKTIVLNPVIARHTNQLVDSKEACKTFPNEKQIIVPRYHKIEVEYQTIMVDPENKDKFKLSNKIQDKLSGFNSFVFQHEISHLQGLYIYPFN